MLPFALATIVGGIDCTESAAAAGDEYDTRTILLTEGLASVAAGACGGVIQNTPYIGHPAYKAMGGRAAYTLATAVFIGAAGLFGWFTHLFEWLPEAAAFPILVFVGLEIAAQSFRATPERHFPALALAILPALAYLALIPVDQSLAGSPPAAACGRGRAIAPLPGQRLHRHQPALGLGLGRNARRQAGRVRPAIWGSPAICSLFGIIHSPLQHGGNRPAVAGPGPDVPRPGHPLPIAVPLGRGLWAGGRAADGALSVSRSAEGEPMSEPVIPTESPDASAGSPRGNRCEVWPWLAIAVVLAVAVCQLRMQGRLWWCACGQYYPWVSDIWSSHNSQHLFDPYSFTHILHGVVFCGLLTWAFPQLSPRWRLFLAISLAAIWEVFENSQFTIERYRAITAAIGYQGDTIFNSLGDILCCGIGFAIARRLGLWRSVVFFLATEAVLLVWIRDDLALNVLMLVYPIDAIRAWQIGH